MFLLYLNAYTVLYKLVRTKITLYEVRYRCDTQKTTNSNRDNIITVQASRSPSARRSLGIRSFRTVSFLNTLFCVSLCLGIYDMHFESKTLVLGRGSEVL